MANYGTVFQPWAIPIKRSFHFNKLDSRFIIVKNDKTIKQYTATKYHFCSLFTLYLPYPYSPISSPTSDPSLIYSPFFSLPLLSPFPSTFSLLLPVPSPLDNGSIAAPENEAH